MEQNEYVHEDEPSKETIIFKNKDDVGNYVKRLKNENTLRDKIIVKLNNTFPAGNKTGYSFTVLDYLSHETLINPYTQEKWEVSCLDRGFKNKQGDNIELLDEYIYSCEYKPKEHQKRFEQIVEPICNTFEIVSKCPELFENCTAYIYNEVIEKYATEEAFSRHISQCINTFYKKQAREKEDEIREREKKIQLQKNEISELEERIKDKQAEKQKIKDGVESLRRLYGYSDDSSVDKTDNTYYTPQSTDNIYRLIQSSIYYQNSEGLLYSEDIIRRFITALFTNQLVLLSGPSGTGKSSLVRQMASVLYNTKVHNIEVQSNWTDVQDLLGFYNPIKNSYVTTPFLQALVEASFDKEALHIICLDEMNLAHIEYYFASILSARERTDGCFINLYATKFSEQAKRKLESKIGRPIAVDTTISDIEEDIFSKSLDEQSELYDLFDLCKVHEAKFKIPDNVRFVGTLNMDETVKNISPKVIDRSFVIELVSTEEKSKIEENLLENRGRIKIYDNPIEIIEFCKRERDNEPPEDVGVLLRLSEALSSIPNARLNNRGEKHIKQYIQCFTRISGEYDSELVIDDLIYSKILPRINFDPSDDKAKRQYMTFIDNITEYKASLSKANQMNENKQIISFWTC